MLMLLRSIIEDDYLCFKGAGEWLKRRVVITQRFGLTGGLNRTNGMRIFMKSIKEGPFQTGKQSQILLLEEPRVSFIRYQYVLESLKTVGEEKERTGKVVVLDVRGSNSATNQGRTFNLGGMICTQCETIFLIADECDAFDSDVDVWSTSPTMFMANFTSEDQSTIDAAIHTTQYHLWLQDHDAFVDHMDEYHDVHEMQNDVQHNYLVESGANYTSDSNIIPFLIRLVLQSSLANKISLKVVRLRHTFVHDIDCDIDPKAVWDISSKVCSRTLNKEVVGKTYTSLGGKTRAYHDDPWPTQNRARSNRQRAGDVISTNVTSLVFKTIAQDARNKCFSSNPVWHNIIGNVNAEDTQHVLIPSRSSQRWSKIILWITSFGIPSSCINQKIQLASDALWCCFHMNCLGSKPRTSIWPVDRRLLVSTMQDEINEFDRLEVWELELSAQSHVHGYRSKVDLQNAVLAGMSRYNEKFVASASVSIEDSWNTMAEQNVPAQPPTRTDEQIVPRSQWLTIGKSNLLFNAQKIQKNPIFQISVDILSNTNFFQAFTASANVPAIYLQQFWKTMSYNEKTGVYSCQLDEQWFDLSADLLRKALAITPVNPTHPFELPPSGDTVIDFVNELGYPEPVEIVSSIRTNYVYQPWRAILSLLNQCLTGKTSGSDKPRHPVLQMLWGIVTQTNVDHAELIWEEFTQGIQTFFSHKASHKASLKNPKKKVTPLLIPYGRFSKVIIYYLASNNNIHRRPDSAVHHTGDDYVLGNLKFVPKGESVEVFGMAIPDPLITEAIQQSSYYPKYLKMVAENTKKTPQESASVQPATKRATPKKPTTTTPVKQTKPAPPPTKKPSKRKLPQKVRKGKPAFQLVDEEDETQQESIPQREDDDPDLDLAKKLSLEAHQEKGEEEGNDADLERAIKLSLDPAFLPQGRAPVGGVTIRDPVSEATPKLHEVVGKGKAVVTDQFILARRDQSPPDSTTGPSSRPDDDTSEKVIHESSSTSDSERTESDTESGTPKGDKVQSEIVTSTVTSGVSIPVSDPEKAHEALAGPNPEPMQEDQTGSDSGKLHVSLAGPNPEHMDDEFLATAYPKVHENLKLITDERVIDDKPESHSGSMSSMKNLDDTFNFGDQFLHDKPTEDDQEKSKVREESDSTIPDSSHQTVTSTPPVIPPFTEVSSSKPSLLVTPPPINTEATTITTSLPEITPFIALQLRVARLEQEMSEVKKTDHSADVLASIRSQVPTAVDNLTFCLDLIEKYSVLPGPEFVKNQESEKSPKEIGLLIIAKLALVVCYEWKVGFGLGFDWGLTFLASVLYSSDSRVRACSFLTVQTDMCILHLSEIIKAKKEQDEEKQDSTYSIRSTDKVDLEEFDLKSALFSHMNKKKSANKNTTNYRLYHALMEALIADEDAMDKEVADKVKDHKRKHDSDDDDDEGPSAGSNQGRSTKKRRSDSAASGSAKPPPKDDDQSSKKPRESDASASKQHPALTSTGWQITNTRDAGADSSMHRSDPESEHSEQSSDDISKQDEGNDLDMEDTDNAHIPKVSTTTWFKPIPESERPATPEPNGPHLPPLIFPKP
ncbi:hypothetical protein Tco_0937327 [Tanacetum coccineum]|uniref:Uncharacterized protein n=1 Tax=Tanacetum coccineum TaxID=301880 RepID=A0ABQ5DF21_9ASTR